MKLFFGEQECFKARVLMPHPKPCNCGECKPTIEGTKHDAGKARYDLFPWDIMDGVIAVYTHGAAEYQDNNWRKGFAWGRIIGAVFRHFVAWINGNDIDDKSGLHNLDQAVWNLLTLRWMQKYGKGIDDRWKNDSPENSDYDWRI